MIPDFLTISFEWPNFSDRVSQSSCSPSRTSMASSTSFSPLIILHLSFLPSIPSKMAWVFKFHHFSRYLHNKQWYLPSNPIIPYIYLLLNSSFHNISTFSSPSKTSSSHPPFLLYFIHLCFSLFASPSIPPLLSMLYIIFHVSLLSIKNHFFNSISL